MEGYIKFKEVPKKCWDCELCAKTESVPGISDTWFCQKTGRVIQKPSADKRPDFCPIKTEGQATEALKTAVEAAKDQFCIESDCTDDYEREHMTNLKYCAMRCIERILKGDDKNEALADFEIEAKELDDEYNYGLFEEV